MFELIKKIFTNNSEPQNSNSEIALNAHLALCVMLLEAAHVDGECSSDEMEHVVSTLVEECGVAKEEIDELIASGRQERNDSVDLFRFTRYMNNNFTKDEKIGVMESVWRVIHTDGQLESHEDHFAHKLANLLRLTHKELIDAKIKARKQLAS